jgi:hypothetical protein
MTAAQRSQMTARASELDVKTRWIQQTLDLVSSGKMSGAGVDHQTYSRHHCEKQSRINNAERNHRHGG